MKENGMTESTKPTAAAATIQLPPTASSPEGFVNDMEALKLSLESGGLSGVPEKVHMQLPVRTFIKRKCFRVRPGGENCFTETDNRLDLFSSSQEARS
jgi:hypothetical protein